jgi:hypothetical protein
LFQVAAVHKVDEAGGGSDLLQIAVANDVD